MLTQLDPDVAAIAGITSVPVILDVVCRATGMGFAAVARVTDDRWVTCALKDQIAFGLQLGDELPIETTLCRDVRADRCVIVIDDVEMDPTYRGHASPQRYGFRSYISVPIILANGRVFGTLCAIDPKPAQVSAPQVIDMFKLFAELIASHLDASERLIAAEAELATERHLAELREQFVAVLGHDLRSPVAAVSSGTSLLLRRDLDSQSRAIVGAMQESLQRMGGLITNILDFARLRLGSPFMPAVREDTVLEPLVARIIDELRRANAHRQIDATVNVSRPIRLDGNRFAQLLSNLVTNAVTHGDASVPIKIDARLDGPTFRLSVENAGRPIPDAIRGDLFKPFVRGGTTGTKEGLGLGLYIANEIARAHDGRIDVDSTPGRTVFIVSLPADETPPAPSR